MIEIFEKSLPFAIVFILALVLTLALTPLVREFNRRIGMVDKPDPRRINKIPVPRGGGVALVIGVLATYSGFLLANVDGRFILEHTANTAYWKLVTLSLAIAAIGFADDKWSLNPKLKLLGQLAVAVLVWAWAGLGFHGLWPSIPAWIDCAMTVFWITGAINAFNLIDGLDGLASGLALIATIGMAGALFLLDAPSKALFYFAFAGGLLGFLRYNYNPASVFLGDTGSMYIGFTLSTMMLVTQTPDSFLVSMGVPLLAMGVPIFDTFLAITRRSVRALILKRDAAKGEAINGKVMTADADHLHHRLLRSAGLNQRKAAWIMYLLALFLVAVGLLGMSLRSRSGGVWLFAVAVASVVIFRDMARIELFDTGRLLNSMARDRSTAARRRLAQLRIPILVTADIAVLVSSFFLCVWVTGIDVSKHLIKAGLPLQCAASFFALAVLNSYGTVWSRAMTSNFLRLFLACAFGATIGAIAFYYLPNLVPEGHLAAFSLLYAMLTFLLLSAVRLARGIVRDMFYAIDCSRLRTRKDVSRILVYGAGIRYRAFRRELVRTTSANDRMIVGIIDDDALLKGQYVGGIKIYGTLLDAPETINSTNADAVVIACEMTPQRLKIAKETLKATGVKFSIFSIGETAIDWKG